MSLTWAVFEILGTVAFAFSGAAVGLARGMDVFGIALLSVVTAVGDVLAGIFPPFALRGPDGIIFALMTAAAVCIGFRHFHIPRRGRKLVLFAYRVSDTAGLAAFTVTGAMTAIDSYPGYRYVLPVLLGLITAGGGGAVFSVTCWRRKSQWCCMKMCMPWLRLSEASSYASCIRSRELYMRHGADLARYFFSVSAQSFSAGGFIVPQGYMAAKADRGNRSRQSIKITW